MAVHLPAGTLFAGDYRILQPLSAGGMGAVYVVEQLSTRKLRALKLMHGRLLADEASRRRFEQEARIGARIESEHVVEVQAAGVDPQSGLPYLVMELLEGETLESMVARRGPLAPAEVRVLIEQICHALGAAHRAGIVHRDLKPLNIFMARARRTDVAFTVKLLDFGIAKLVSEGATHTAAVGSPFWLAPEQAGRGQITPATDVWALGLVAYFLLTGTSFWVRPSVADPSVAQLMNAVLFDPIPAASARAGERGCALPSGFDAWFAACVNRDPASRFTDAHHAFAHLAALLPPGGVLGPDAGAPLGVAAALRTAYESGQLGTGASWSGAAMAGATAGASFGRGFTGTSGTFASRGMTTAGTGFSSSQGRASLTAAPVGFAAGCLVAAGLLGALGVAVGLGAYVVLSRPPSEPTAASQTPGGSSVPEPVAGDVAPRTGEDAPAIPAVPQPGGPPGARPLPAQAAGAAAAAPIATPTPTVTAPSAALPPPTGTAKGGTSPPPAVATATTTPGTAGERPTEDLAWKIGHAVHGTDLKPCLYSKITRPSHGTFAVRHVVTVRFAGTRLLGVDVQGSSTYPASDLINRDTYKPPSQAEVDAELSRVLTCIRGKAGGAGIPSNQARGAVAIKFSGPDLYGASVL